MPTLFLDIDDVICLNKRWSGHDAVRAIYAVRRGHNKLDDFSPLWADLFDASAKTCLLSLCREFKPQIVISSTWARHFDRPGLIDLFTATGLGEIPSSLAQRWTTRDYSPAYWSRAEQIQAWLVAHPLVTDWVVVDDEHSGTGFETWPDQDRRYVVRCERDVGLTETKGEELRRALQARVNAAAQERREIVDLDKETLTSSGP